MDFIVTLLGIFYGAALIVTTFVSNKITEALRIDTLLLPKANPNTRILNLIIGILVLGYCAYPLLKPLF